VAVDSSYHARNLSYLRDREQIERQQRFQRAWKTYEGEHPKTLRVRRPRRARSAPVIDDNVTVNYSRIVVDKGVWFLFGKEVGFKPTKGIGQDPLPDESEQEKWLRQCWIANKKMTTLQKWAINGGVCGHGFIKIVTDSRLTDPFPRLVVLDPSCVDVEYEEHDIDVVRCYTITYESLDVAGNVVVKQQLFEYNELTEYWDIIWRESVSDGEWIEISREEWPYTWAPIVDVQNLPLPNVYWGLSDIETDVLDLNYAMNGVMSNIRKIIRHHAHPKTWARGLTEKQVRGLDVSVENVIGLPSENAEMRNLEMQSDLSSSITYYQRLREAFHEVTEIPEVATGQMESVGSLSGLALQILYGPLIEKTETKRRTYGDGLVELNEHLLELAGLSQGGEEAEGRIRVSLVWPDIVPVDEVALRQALEIDVNLGASRETALTRLGYNAKKEMEASKKEEPLNPPTTTPPPEGVTPPNRA